MTGPVTREALRKSFIIFGAASFALSWIIIALALISGAGPDWSPVKSQTWLASISTAGILFGAAAFLEYKPAQNTSPLDPHPSTTRYAQKSSNTLTIHRWPSGKYWESYGPEEDSMDQSHIVIHSGCSAESSA